MRDSCCMLDVRIVGKKLGIELFTDSHVERKKSNKNFEKSGFKHIEEKIGQNSRSVMQEFVEIISLQVSTGIFPGNFYLVYYVFI